MGAPKPITPLVFFFAFDQPEGRDELFDDEGDWRKFFAQLSGLYNSLPNVFILFTMTPSLGKRLHSAMEGQFRDRIQRDHEFLLHAVEDREVLALYQRHIENWLGAAVEEVRPKIEELANPYLPFDQKQVIELARKQTLRDMLKKFDQQFRAVIVNSTTEAVLDYRTFQKEIRRDEPADSPYRYTMNHLRALCDLLTHFGPTIAQQAGLNFCSAIASDESDEPRHLVLYFEALDDRTRWVRVFVCRLTMHWRKWAEKFINQLANRHRNKNLLFLLRNKDFDLAVPVEREQQIFPRVYPVSVHTDLQAMLRLLPNRTKYEAKSWELCEQRLASDQITVHQAKGGALVPAADSCFPVQAGQSYQVTIRPQSPHVTAIRLRDIPGRIVVRKPEGESDGRAWMFPIEINVAPHEFFTSPNAWITPSRATTARSRARSICRSNHHAASTSPSWSPSG